MQIVAVVAAVAVAAGAVVTLPTFIRFLHAGGWTHVRRRLRRAMVATGVVVVAGAGLVAWANSLSFGQRNGSDPLYGLGVLIWAVSVVVTLALWTIAAVVVGRRLPMTRAVRVTAATLASVLTAAMIAITSAAAIWWAAMAAHAPWFLHGTAPGSRGSGFEPRLAITMTVMACALIVGSYGTLRAARSANQLRHH